MNLNNMQISCLGRRDFIKYSLMTSLFILSGCSTSKQKLALRGVSNTFPNEFINCLSSSWEFLPIKDQIESFYVDSYGIYRRRVNPKVVKILDFSSIGYSAIAEDIEILSFQGHPPSATEDAKF